MTNTDKNTSVRSDGDKTQPSNLETPARGLKPANNGSANGDENDPFSHPEMLRIDPGYLRQPVAKKILTTVPIRKPGKQDFVRVHPDEEYRHLAHLVELRDERETYLVLPKFIPELGEGEFYTATLYLAINRQRTLSVWPVRMPSPDGRISNWQTSAAEAVARAMRDWIRIVPNMNMGAYEILEAAGNFGDPEWPEMPFMDILRIAFKGRLIESHDHHVVQRLRGLK